MQMVGKVCCLQVISLLEMKSGVRMELKLLATFFRPCRCMARDPRGT